MKKLSVILAMLMALAILPAAGVSADAVAVNDGNMLVNPSFDVADDPATEDVNESGWELTDETSASASSGVGTIGMAIKSGTGMGHGDDTYLEVTEKHDRATQRITGISRDEDYMISLYTKNAEGSNLRGPIVGVLFRNGKGGKISGYGEQFLPADPNYAHYVGSWRRTTITILGENIPEGAEQVEFFIRCQNGSGTMYVDDVYFGKAVDAKTKNMILNPSFSEVTENTFDNWEIDDDYAKITVCNDNGHNDSHSVKFTGYVTNGGTISQNVAIEPNTDYLFGLHYYNKSGAAKIILNFLKTDGTKAGSLTLTKETAWEDQLKKKNDWTKFEVRFNNAATESISNDVPIPAETASINISLSTQGRGTEGNHLWFDDVYMHEATSEVSYTVTNGETTTPIESLTAGTVNVTYKGNLPSAATSTKAVLAVAALYKTEGAVKTLAGVRVMSGTLTPGAYAEIPFEGISVAETDLSKYSIRVLILVGSGQLAPFERFSVLVPAAPEA